jgi:hypothetical protein
MVARGWLATKRTSRAVVSLPGAGFRGDRCPFFVVGSSFGQQSESAARPVGRHWGAPRWSLIWGGISLL